MKLKSENIIFLGLFFVLAMVLFFQAPKLYYWEENTKPSFGRMAVDFLKFVGNYSPKAKASLCPEATCDCSQRFLELSAQKKTDVLSPYKVLILGDSFVNGGIGIELEKALINCSSTEVVRVSKPSTGLTRRDYFDWRGEAEKLLNEHNPNIVFVMFGANDAQGIVLHGYDDIEFGTPEWDVEYAKRIGEFMDILASRKLRFFWIGNPIARQSEYRDKMGKLNVLYKTQASNYKNEEFIDTWEMLKCAEKDYCDYLPDENGQLQLARESDGIHVTSFGGKIIAKEIVKILEKSINFECLPKN